MELADLLQPRQQRRIAQRIQLVLAQVVAASLQITDIERAEDRLQKRHILEEELLLQVLRAGRDNHALLPRPRQMLSLIHI